LDINEEYKARDARRERRILHKVERKNRRIQEVKEMIPEEKAIRDARIARQRIFDMECRDQKLLRKLAHEDNIRKRQQLTKLIKLTFGQKFTKFLKHVFNIHQA
jgi:hypothetical protein